MLLLQVADLFLRTAQVLREKSFILSYTMVG